MVTLTLQIKALAWQKHIWIDITHLKWVQRLAEAGMEDRPLLTGNSALHMPVAAGSAVDKICMKDKWQHAAALLSAGTLGATVGQSEKDRKKKTKMQLSTFQKQNSLLAK